VGYSRRLQRDFDGRRRGADRVFVFVVWSGHLLRPNRSIDPSPFDMIPSAVFANLCLPACLSPEPVSALCETRSFVATTPNYPVSSAAASLKRQRGVWCDPVQVASPSVGGVRSQRQPPSPGGRPATLTAQNGARCRSRCRGRGAARGTEQTEGGLEGSGTK
jgi:hypothetical protein